MPHIFISYRREDSSGYAGRLYEALAAAFGKHRIFFDIDTIEAGQDFPSVLRATLAQCDTAIVVIGREWLGMAGAQGRRRLDDPADFVRQEIVDALEHQMRVIPVLVGGARMPAAGELPEVLQPLAFRNACEISDRFFHESVRQLIQTLKSGPNNDGYWHSLTRRKFLIPATTATALGGAAVIALFKPSVPENTATPKETPSDAPELDLPNNDSVPAVTVRTPDKISAPPAVVAGPSRVSGRIAPNALGPRHPKLLWAARITIGDTWKPLGFAPDGTVYLYDEEANTLSGVARGREQWAYRWAYGWFPRGIAPDGRVWFDAPVSQEAAFTASTARGKAVRCEA